MKISQLYIFPIKSINGARVTEATVTDTGFQYDRSFMLLKVLDAESEPPKLKNMHVTDFTQMVLFQASVNVESSTMTVCHTIPGHSEEKIDIPLQPDTSSLSTVDIVMHQSPTTAFIMDTQYNDWFSARFGFPVMLAYIGSYRRPILGTFSPKSSAGGIFSKASQVLSYMQTFGYGKSAEEITHGITFADCASFLIVSDKSLQNASARLPEGAEMDVRRFRPNIVVEGAESAWEEDFWGIVQIEGEQEVEIELTANCIRCTSINIDYATGKHGLGEEGKMLKKLMSDRRVDSGAKYSPVFGRYGYLKKGKGAVVSVGSEMGVVQKNEQRTTFDWPL